MRIVITQYKVAFRSLERIIQLMQYTGDYEIIKYCLKITFEIFRDSGINLIEFDYAKD